MSLSCIGQGPQTQETRRERAGIGPFCPIPVRVAFWALSARHLQFEQGDFHIAAVDVTTFDANSNSLTSTSTSPRTHHNPMEGTNQQNYPCHFQRQALRCQKSYRRHQCENRDTQEFALVRRPRSHPSPRVRTTYFRESDWLQLPLFSVKRFSLQGRGALSERNAQLSHCCYGDEIALLSLCFHDT